jgi:type IV secretory pathway VirB2 component (pilin)
MKTKVRLCAVAAAMALTTGSAEAQGLSRARSVLDTLRGEIMLLVPVVAVLSLVVLGVLWGLRVIRFHTLAQWGGGILVVGCASQLVSMLLS